MSTPMADEYVPPASPAAYVMWHILEKGFQAGSIIGVAAVVPTLFLWRKVREPAALLRAMGYSSLVGVAATGTLGAVKFLQIDQAGFEDRAYRLHYNAGQHRTDTIASAGMALGFAAAALWLPKGAPSYGLALVGGSAVGCALGVAAHLATRPEEQRTHNKALHELKRTD
ncbi:hypothetical protein TSOC_001126 [Tetrabaena socialis]|uniref:Uncharacterized protein n=1 Tax=Tetrabaena socialis TaxID=47790 RepID=A0A2J8AHL2_9CHLO|nr:hypothetical protein TSOC_001126 [Tetrabaena socialis]|eukprot:PNH11996.1 hypothetical protein TSOC_001126 [Tetrabaena socialis]